MFKFIFQQWKNRKATVLLIIIGFFIGSLVISLGISASVESLEYINDQKGGNPEQQLDIFLSSDGDWNQKDVEDIVEALSEFGEVQILSMGNRRLNQYNDSFPIVPVLFHQEPDWHIPLIEGRYFSKEDMKENKSIIVGKSIATEHNIKIGDSLIIEGEKFHVIGIGGRSSRETSWEYAIYMTWNEYLAIYEDSFLEENNLHSVSIHLESGKEQFMKKSNMIIERANQKGIQLIYENVNNVDSSSFRNSLVITIVATVLIFTIAIINIIQVMLYWLMERKREIGIMKALGATNRYIAKTVLMEVLTMSIIGCLLAISVQYLSMLLLSDSSLGKEITFKVTWLNLYYAMGVSLFFGMVSAITPALNAMRLEPINAINRT
ncbi:ABC transporter permease [Lederbergia sp. NSJ-179]|uniref:ABC transporter permease n=1 Tax=Lederbergia sp. NSJ-179 TaxID=2931402 RepID=UPI001FD21E27|nr:ABC transporter permease [Lederbergia sp. NSJ-179]MCJ7840019.1 ABC transporter permease [Lederbergia sp. NSJ-179]